MKKMSDKKLVLSMLRETQEYKLWGRGITSLYSCTELQYIFNGIGPDRFPRWLRKKLNVLFYFLLPAAFIHDIEYHIGGSYWRFTLANLRLWFNGIVCCFHIYRWSDIMRYYLSIKIFWFALLCQIFGYVGWNKKCQ